MIFDYKETSTLDLAFDTESAELLIGGDIVVAETLVRRLKDMKSLFRNPTGYGDDLALYYMYNDIYRPQHQELFLKQGIKYEYTLLQPTLINGECVKAHGHVHGISPLTKTNYLEAYEVLGGNGYFELFKITGDNCEVILVEVKEGDFVIIPPGYYHLSINTGNIPFNFGDLIVRQPDSDYGLLKEYQGAPFYCLKNENEEIIFELNEHYKDMKISLQKVTAETVPWQIPIAKVALYAHFVANPQYFDFLK